MADLVLLNYKKICEPFCDPLTPVVDHVIYRGKTEHVDTVIVGGRIVYKQGAFTQVDRKATLDAISASLVGPPSNDDVGRRQLSQALLPHIRQFYSDWRLPEVTPYYGLNSRI